MTNAVNLDNDAIAQAGLADAEHQHGPGYYNDSALQKETHQLEVSSSNEEDWPDKPTEEDLRTLKRVSGPIKWSMWTIAFVELCERFSYYGSSVLYTNFVNRPLPDGSTTGAAPNHNDLPGALGMGPKAAQGISLFNQFFAYVMPLLG